MFIVMLKFADNRADLQARVEADPFVVENVVTAEILEIDPARADERLGFLLNAPAAA